MKAARFLMMGLVLAACTGALAAPDGPTAVPKPSASLTIDNSTFIDANKILMFITNHGNFGRDFDAVFGYWHGTFWPYLGDTSLIKYNIEGAADQTPLYAAGLWLGGIDHSTGDTLMAIADYSDEYVPGPMEYGWFLPDDPSFKVYKLYVDSLGPNPNDDYFNWPVDHGAPVDAVGNPLMLGRQMLWSVFNDADPAAHTNDAGETAPLGIEVQQLVWAGDALGDDTIYYDHVFPVQHVVSSDLEIEVTAWAVDVETLTGDEYRVTFEDTLHTVPIPDAGDGNTLDTVAFYAWHVDNITSAERVLEWQLPDSTSETVEGIRVRVMIQPYGFSNFEVVANNSGALDPPEAGAAGWAGFPVPVDEYGDPLAPTSRQQATANSKWLFHVRSLNDNHPDFEAFKDVQESAFPTLGYYDYEMRFTGSNSNPEVGGSYASSLENCEPLWVPFELWRTGIATLDDPSDDVRLVPVVFDLGGGLYEGDGVFAIGSWGTENLGTCTGYCEHPVSDGDDDPYTDHFYWYVPVDESPGQAGYVDAVDEMFAGSCYPGVLSYRSAMDRTVLVSWDGGEEPPFEQNCPEEGTVFRITTYKPDILPDVFTFTADKPPSYVSTLEGSSVYIQYKIYNKGDRTIKDMYVGLWNDPDLGGAGDDFVGCDTLNDIWFCYNSTNEDGAYGVAPPALGFKLLHGPLVNSPGDTGFFDGNPLPDHANLGMTAFTLFIGGDDPDNVTQTYSFLRGLTKSGNPYVYEDDTLSYRRSGDPVEGTGDLDMYYGDRRMMAASGPFDMSPGDSQYVLIKMTVAQGSDNLNSITELKAVLNEPFAPMTTVDEGIPLPSSLHVRQNYPNPFNPTTRIEYNLPARARVTIDVFNILGQRVRRLVDKTMPAGRNFVIWDGTDQNNRKLATGLYFYRVRAGDSVESKKMLLLK